MRLQFCILNYLPSWTCLHYFKFLRCKMRKHVSFFNLTLNINKYMKTSLIHFVFSIFFFLKKTLIVQLYSFLVSPKPLLLWKVFNSKKKEVFFSKWKNDVICNDANFIYMQKNYKLKKTYKWKASFFFFFLRFVLWFYPH